MNTALVDLKTGELTKFEPQEFRTKNAVHDARIELAARLSNVDALEKEIDAKLDDQEDAVNWWKATVRPNSRPKKTNAESALLTTDQAETIIGYSQQDLSRWAKKLEHRAEYREAISRAARKKMQLEPEHHHRTNYTGENEWYTPAKFIELAREVMGSIDLDPASSDKAQKRIQAENYFTAKDNGLRQEWHGNIWLNPPYAQPLIYDFAEKLITECTEGRVSQAIMLTHNSTDTLWFHRVEEIAAALCFTRGRIAFEDPHGDRCAPTQGQAFFYIGEKAEDFASIFKAVGFVR